MKTRFIILLMISITLNGFKSLNVKPVDIRGKWISVSPEKTATGSYGTREFFIGKSAWQIRYTLYSDSALRNPIFIFRGVGKYELTDVSKIVPGAREAVFRFNKKYITTKTNDNGLIQKYGLGSCNLNYNKETDITETGCAYLASKAVCGQEYDLVSLKNNMLYLGERPVTGGLCSAGKRPKQLGFPLERVSY